jgi:hypothetical protein
MARREAPNTCRPANPRAADTSRPGVCLQATRRISLHQDCSAFLRLPLTATERPRARKVSRATAYDRNLGRAGPQQTNPTCVWDHVTPRRVKLFGARVKLDSDGTSGQHAAPLRPWQDDIFRATAAEQTARTAQIVRIVRPAPSPPSPLRFAHPPPAARLVAR